MRYALYTRTEYLIIIIRPARYKGETKWRTSAPLPDRQSCTGPFGLACHDYPVTCFQRAESRSLSQHCSRRLGLPSGPMSKQRLQAIENIELRGSKHVLNFHRRQKIRFVIDFPKAVDLTGKEGLEGGEGNFCLDQLSMVINLIIMVSRNSQF